MKRPSGRAWAPAVRWPPPDDRLRLHDSCWRGQVGLLDDRELTGMDGRAAQEAQGAAVGAGRGEALQVPDVGVHRLRRRRQARRPRGHDHAGAATSPGPRPSRTPRSARRSASPRAIPRTRGGRRRWRRRARRPGPIPGGRAGAAPPWAACRVRAHAGDLRGRGHLRAGAGRRPRAGRPACRSAASQGPSRALTRTWTAPAGARAAGRRSPRGRTPCGRGRPRPPGRRARRRRPRREPW